MSREVICFGFNKIYRVYNRTEWRANYLGFTDSRVIDNCRDELPELTGEIFISDQYMRNMAYKFDNVQYWHMIDEYFPPNNPRFSADITACTYMGFSVLYDMGIQFAAYMGFAEIYLIGADHFYCGDETDSENHFIHDYFLESEKEIFKKLPLDRNLLLQHSAKAFREADKYSREHGFRIFNATRGGKLEAFERVNFDDLF